nr:MAG TPA: GEMININ, MULTICILIN CYCLE, DNA REPLICATION LICENSING [Caudoviricetes sp.]
MKENSREDRINNAYCFLNSMHSDFRTGLYYKEDLENLDHILSDYKRVLKENEQLRTEVNSLKEDNERYQELELQILESEE